MIKVILVDDEQPALEIMRTYLAPLNSEVAICSACTDVKTAIRDVELHQPDILLLDIELGDGLGFEVLEHFPQLDARIIFVTAHDDYVLRAIKFHAFDYLFKPIVAAELQDAVRKAIYDISTKKPLQNSVALLDFIKGQSKRRIAVPSRNGLNYYNLDDIVYIEADGSYAIIHFSQLNSVTISRKVKDFEISLSDKGYLRVHKSYLVNINHIAQLHREDSGYLLMSNQARIPISPKDKERVIERIRQYCTVI